MLVFLYYSNLTYDGDVYCDLFWAHAQADAEIETFPLFHATVRGRAAHSAELASGSDREECRVCVESDGHLVATLVAICRAIVQIRVLDLLDG